MNIQNFIIVDDEPFFCKLSSMLLKKTLGEVDVKTFTMPEEGLKFLHSQNSKTSKQTVLFLDINMPTLNGWEFMEEYEELSPEVKKQIVIYILSSSINQVDKDKAEANKYIAGFLSKPLMKETIISIAEGVEGFA